MSVWHGRHGKRAMMVHRARKRAEAEARDEVTEWARTAAYRRLQERLNDGGSR